MARDHTSRCCCSRRIDVEPKNAVIRPLLTLALVCTAAWGCRAALPRAAAPSEPPPPLIEPEVGRGAGLVDPRADALVRQMSEHLARAGAFALEAEELYDEVPEHSPRQQLTTTPSHRDAPSRPAGGRCVGRRGEPLVLVRRERCSRRSTRNSIAGPAGRSRRRWTGRSTGYSSRPAPSFPSPISCMRIATSD